MTFSLSFVFLHSRLNLLLSPQPRFETLANEMLLPALVSKYLRRPVWGCVSQVTLHPVELMVKAVIAILLNVCSGVSQLINQVPVDTCFDLVCANAWMLDLTQAILNLGFLAGAFTLGYAADRYGRILIYLISCFGVGVTGVVVAFAPNFSVFVIFRFLQGVFGKGAWMTCFVIVTEIVGSKQRRIVGIVVQMFFTLGIILLPGIAYFIPSWQGVQLAISLPSFLFLLYYWVVPESPRWLITRKQGEKALQILRHVAKCNGKYLSPNYSEITVTDEEVSNPSFLDLVRTPQMRKCTLILMYAWFTSAVVYQGLVMRLGIVGGNLYIDFFISGLVELPAALLILLTIERLGRRLPFAASNIVAGVACLVTAFLPEGIPWLRTTVATLGRLGITMAFEIVYLVNSELYPTTLRNFGVSLCSGLCDFGGIIAPFLLFRLAAIWLELPLIIFGILATICGGLVMLLPETKGIALPETVDDVEKLGRFLSPGLRHDSAVQLSFTSQDLGRGPVVSTRF
ncbi:hypothetical protein STEG23_012865 [Scotinomys teguina]